MTAHNLPSLREALEIGLDLARAFASEQRELYGKYPPDGLGRKCVAADRDVAIIEAALAAHPEAVPAPSINVAAQEASTGVPASQMGPSAAATPPQEPRDALPDSSSAVQELRNIVNAKRFNREHFEDDTAFADWAQSRARHTLSHLTERSGEVPQAPTSTTERDA